MTRVERSLRGTILEVAIYGAFALGTWWFSLQASAWFFLAMSLLSVILHVERMAAERYYIKEGKEQPAGKYEAAMTKSEVARKYAEMYGIPIATVGDQMEGPGGYRRKTVSVDNLLMQEGAYRDSLWHWCHPDYPDQHHEETDEEFLSRIRYLKAQSKREA